MNLGDRASYVFVRVVHDVLFGIKCHCFYYDGQVMLKCLATRRVLVSSQSRYWSAVAQTVTFGPAAVVAEEGLSSRGRP